jgi:hypothetical protein
MALAVAEAHRLLRPGGLLIGLHPAAEPARLEVWDRGPALDTHQPGDYQRACLGSLQADDRSLGEFAATHQALRAAAQAGFEALAERAFDYRYFFESLDELTDYLEETEELDLAGDHLLEQALLALQRAPGRAWLVLAQPVIATRLAKRTAP